MYIDQHVFKSLSPAWRKAFLITLQIAGEPTNEQLLALSTLTVLRLAGPQAPYPNCDFVLNTLEGLAYLPNLELLIITNHGITTIEEVAALKHLKGLFIFENNIQSLKGIEKLVGLEQLYVQNNALTSIQEIEKLTRLREVQVNSNFITSLAGLTEAHADNLKTFKCLPNEGLKQKEIIYAERELGIICR